jgi:phage recombination protein Bet
MAESKTAIAEKAPKPITVSPQLQAMADRYGLNPSTLYNTLLKTVFPSGKQVTAEQMAMFVVVAEKYGLNPFTREIYAFPNQGGGIVPIVSVDGWANIINSHPQCDGIEFEDQVDGEGMLIAITARIYRKDRSHPTSVTEYMTECRRDTSTWGKWPARMLRHKALIQAARYAFGFAGIFDLDEAQRIAENGEAEPEERPMPKRKSETVQTITVEPEQDISSLTEEPPPDTPTQEEFAKTAELRSKAENLYLALAQLGRSDDAIAAIDKAAGVSAIEHVQPGDLAAVIAGLEKLGKKTK